MSEKEAVQTPKLRRGVSNETRAVSQLLFHEKDAAPNGLFMGHLHRVSVEYSVGQDTSSFAGLRMPRLVFEFCSNHVNANEMRHYIHSVFPIDSNVDTIPGGKSAWRVDQVLRFIKHMLDVYYLKGRQLTPEEEDKLTLPFVDFDESGQYVAVDTQDVVNGYEFVFRNVSNIFNGIADDNKDGKDIADAKPIYKTADGKFINCWMKLIRHKKQRNGDWTNVNNGELGFDSFIGAGVVELAKGTNPPAILMLDLSKESITPKDTKKTPTIGGQAVPSMMGGVMAGGPVNVGVQTNSAFNEATAGGEMPF